MHLFFIDESGTISPPGKSGSEDKFVLGGIIISESTWFKINADLKQLRKKYNVTGEIKWRYFFSLKNHQTPLSHLTPDVKEQLRTDLYKIINQYKSIKIISAIADVQQSYKRLQNMHYKMMHSEEEFTSKFGNILEGVFIVPSHFSTGIQLADMVARGIYRWFVKNDDRYYRQIHSRIRMDSNGRVEGFGIVKLH